MASEIFHKMHAPALIETIGYVTGYCVAGAIGYLKGSYTQTGALNTAKNWANLGSLVGGFLCLKRAYDSYGDPTSQKIAELVSSNFFASVKDLLEVGTSVLVARQAAKILGNGTGLFQLLPFCIGFATQFTTDNRFARIGFATAPFFGMALGYQFAKHGAEHHPFISTRRQIQMIALTGMGVGCSLAIHLIRKVTQESLASELATSLVVVPIFLYLATKVLARTG